MSSFHRYYNRGRFPTRFWGKRALKKMNGKKHAALPEWAFPEIQDGNFSHILDIGCGGGANIQRMLDMFPKSVVTGLDISHHALDMTRDVNAVAVSGGRCFVVGGNANQMPLPKESFDLATAFETVYYWSGITACFTEVLRVLKPGGTFLIANELDGLAEDDRRLERVIGMLRIYNIDELVSALTVAGFVNINARHDEKRRFISIKCQKP